MAKDDYDVIAYKILAYLYTKLKAGEEMDPKMIGKDSQLFSIPEKYWAYIMVNLQGEGLIRGIVCKRAWGNEITYVDCDNCEITPDGIRYLTDNSFVEKVKQFLKDTKEITPFI